MQYKIVIVCVSFNVLMHSCIRAKQLPREVNILSILFLYLLVTKVETTRILRLISVVFKIHYLHTINTIIYQNECKYELISYVFLTYEIRILVY